MAYYVILDSGHAEKVKGKRSCDGSMYEWEFNNDMQYKLEKRLKEHGIIIYMTNPSPKGKDEIGLSKRCSLANTKWTAWGKPSNCLFISIHSNAHLSTWSSARGVEVFTSNGCSSKSTKASQCVCEEIYKGVKSNLDSKFLNRGNKKENYTVITKTNMPAILIEYGFYTNKSDLAILKNNRNDLVEYTVKGICKHFGITYKKPTQTNSNSNNTTIKSNNKFKNGDYDKNYKVKSPDGKLSVRKTRPNDKGELGTQIDELKNGDIVFGAYCLNDWIGVYYNGKEGFVNMEYLEEYKEVKNGWVKENGYFYYYDNNVMKKGVITVDGKKYYLQNDGKLLTDLVIDSNGVITKK